MAYNSKDDLNQAVFLALKTITEGKQALVFTSSKLSAEKTAEEISLEIAEGKKLSELRKDILSVGSTSTTQCKKLANCVEKGIAFHHAGLLAGQRELIEENFRLGKIKVICATPTLAMGVSTPAFRVIVKSLKRYNDKRGMMDWISNMECHQMMGRAGRPEFNESGEAILIASSEHEEERIKERYIYGEIEPVQSKLAVEPVFRMHLLSLISTGNIASQEGAEKFFAQTLWAQQFGDMDEVNVIITRMLSLLEEYGMILRKKEIFGATYLGRRVAELYLDPTTANSLVQRMKNAAKMIDKGKINDFSFFQAFSYTFEMEPLLRVKKKEEEEIWDKLMEQYESLLEAEPEELYLRDFFMNSIKTALFFQEWVSEKDEEYLLEKYDIRPGEIRAKLEKAEWLLYAGEELSKALQLNELVSVFSRLRVRVKYGIKDELVPLVKVRGVGRVRARKLFNNGVKDIGDLRLMEKGWLAKILGKETAEEVKLQVGGETEAVKENKRKGQINLNDF